MAMMRGACLVLMINAILAQEVLAEDVTCMLQSKTSATARGHASAVKQKSVELAHRFALAAKSSESGTTKQLLKSFEICGQCNKFQRFGEGDDGGYLMCMDGLQNTTLRSAYSIGVEHHDQWSADVVKLLGVPVNQFDCTVNGDATCHGCKFFKKCLVSTDGLHPVPGHEAEGISLAQALAETSQANATDNSLLMKMDIEGSEWAIFATEPPQALQKFAQVIMELHWLNKEELHPVYLQAMQHILAAGFKVAHLHGNNFSPMYFTGGQSIPDVVEITFVHAAARPNGCSADQLVEPLDHRNNNGAVELPLAHLE
jgi:hypothetical protein